MTQPTALFLADILEDAGKPADIAEKCAAELRRLHAQRDALLETLKALIDMDVAYKRGPRVEEAVEMARAAIAKAEENT